mgnify:CR=1 FL=1
MANTLRQYWYIIEGEPARTLFENENVAEYKISSGTVIKQLQPEEINAIMKELGL